MRSIWPCILAASTGCGFKSTAGGGNAVPDAAVIDAAGGDGSGSGSDAGPQTKDCFARWMAGTIKPATPVAIAGLSAPGIDERDPWLTPDGLELYYSRQPTTGNADSDVYRSVRTSVTDPFPAGSKFGISQSSGESRATMTADRKTIVFSSDRSGGNKWLVYSGTRSDIAQDFGTVTTDRTSALNLANDQYDPFLTRDGLEIYYAPFPPPGTQQLQHIYVASRATITDSFGAPTPVATINQAGAYDADPALSPDRRLIVFSSTRPGTGDSNLWYATRDTATGSFGTPVPIPMVNGTFADGDPVLSEDGCTLYFASKRANNGDYDIYQSAVDDSAMAQ